MKRTIIATLFLAVGAAIAWPDEPPNDGVDMTKSLRFVEWHRDIKPILTAKCGECHMNVDPEVAPNTFVIDDDLRTSVDLVGDKRLHGFAATQSSLIDQVLARIDEDHETLLEAMPPETHEPLTPEEFRLLSTWVDMGMPVDKGGYFTGLPPEKGDPFNLPVKTVYQTGGDPPPPDPEDPCAAEKAEITRLLGILKAFQKSDAELKAHIVMLNGTIATLQEENTSLVLNNKLLSEENQQIMEELNAAQLKINAAVQALSDKSRIDKAIEALSN